MNPDILRILLENAGLNGKVIVSGQEVLFYDAAIGRTKPLDAPNESPYDTPKNRAIVADVIANYDTLAAEWEAEQAKEAADNAIKAALAAIDLKSIRSIREWLAKQADAPQFVKDHEAAAIAEREKLK
jgi:hypothetical protein